VKNHVSRLLLKVDARDLTSAVLKAIASRVTWRPGWRQAGPNFKL
jgi:hypothetical protein